MIGSTKQYSLTTTAVWRTIQDASSSKPIDIKPSLDMVNSQTAPIQRRVPTGFKAVYNSSNINYERNKLCTLF